MENCVPVRRDLSDLVQRVRWLQANPHEAARIGLAGRRLAEHVLTRASAMGQWARTLALAARTPDEAWAPPHLQRALDPLLRRLGAVGRRGEG